MISNSTLIKKRIITVCEHSREIAPGSEFDSVEFADRPIRFPAPASKKIICVGSVSEEEMLFRTGDSRYWFSSVAGCGTEGSRLFCVALGLFFDFGHSTDDTNIIDECSRIIKNANYHSACGALEYAAKLEAMIKIIKVQRDIPKALQKDTVREAILGFCDPNRSTKHHST